MAANFVKLVGTGDKKEHLQKVKLKLNNCLCAHMFPMEVLRKILMENGGISISETLSAVSY